MKSSSTTKFLATFLTIAIVAPSVFFAAPQRATAILGVGDIVVDPTNLVQNTITAIRSTLTHALQVTSTAAQVAEQVNTYVLQPLAFTLSGDILKAITAGVISFVIGKANGTGIPQFVTDVEKSLQTVGDITALTFLDQFGKNSNSPFAASISSSLRNDYLSRSSLAGFWADNMDTLAASTPSYSPDYLSGNWSHGGIRAWFALTTQTENNPYALYHKSQDQLASMVGSGSGGATGARLAELNWGDGFSSWCGEFGDSYTPEEQAAGVNPGDPCINEDGSKGTIKTPGSVIVASLNKALGSQTDAILRMGNVGPEINGILQNIGTVMQTVNFATQILGGPGSGGLFGVGETSSTNTTSRLIDYQTRSGYLGVTSADIYANESKSNFLTRITEYESAWSTIASVANIASGNLTSLEDSCPAQAVEAQTVLTSVISPVITQAAAAASKISVARAIVESGDTPITESMSPTVMEVTTAKQEALVLGTAIANPEGSLAVSGGSIMDRLNLININAQVLAAVCAP